MLLRDSTGRSVEFHLSLPPVSILLKIGLMLALSLVMRMVCILLIRSIILSIMSLMPSMDVIPI